MQSYGEIFRKRFLFTHEKWLGSQFKQVFHSNQFNCACLKSGVVFQCCYGDPVEHRNLSKLIKFKLPNIEFKNKTNCNTHSLTLILMKHTK